MYQVCDSSSSNNGIIYQNDIFSFYCRFQNTQFQADTGFSFFLGGFNKGSSHIAVFVKCQSEGDSGSIRESLSSGKPSKEWPLHLKVYQKKPGTGAVLHTHGTYGVLWSFVPAEDETDAIPDHTPYLKMKLGKVGLIPYEKPGSQALFDAFGQRVMDSDGYLLKQHGAVVPGKNLMDAFYCLEELEESARIAWMLREAGLR